MYALCGPQGWHVAHGVRASVSRGWDSQVVTLSNASPKTLLRLSSAMGRPLPDVGAVTDCLNNIIIKDDNAQNKDLPCSRQVFLSQGMLPFVD